MFGFLALCRGVGLSTRREEREICYAEHLVGSGPVEG